LGSSFPLQFNTIPYPIWRRNLPFGLNRLIQPLAQRYLAADADLTPPTTPEAVVDYMLRWHLLGSTDPLAAFAVLNSNLPSIETTQPTHINPHIPFDSSTRVRLPAQWEPMETILLTWPSLYPQLWEQHAQMVEAITPVSSATILVTHPMWAKAAHLFLSQRGKADLRRVRFLHLPTDDIWVRDYGPVVAQNEKGEQVCVKLVFDPLPSYPQQQDNSMALRWASHEEIPVRHLDLHLEGGNIWSDGRGTLIMADQIFHSNPSLTRTGLLDQLHRVFDFSKLIITPRLEREETGHVDLLVKLADAETVLITRPSGPNRAALQQTINIFRRTSNTSGQSYRIFELPNPRLYLNWGVYPVWRSYTNSLTVNGRVLVPVFGISTDAEALAIYRKAMPDFDIIPIDCAPGANGGGAVHCLTKEVAAPRRG
jgi:agmatine deiminase